MRETVNIDVIVTSASFHPAAQGDEYEQQNCILEELGTIETNSFHILSIYI